MRLRKWQNFTFWENCVFNSLKAGQILSLRPILHFITSIPQHCNSSGSFLSIQNELLIATQQARFEWKRAKSCCEICNKITQICKAPFAASPAICNLKLSLSECCSDFCHMQIATQGPRKCLRGASINSFSLSSTYFLLPSNCGGRSEKVSFKDRPIP